MLWMWWLLLCLVLYIWMRWRRLSGRGPRMHVHRHEAWLRPAACPDAPFLQVLVTEGDNRLGGDDFTTALLLHVLAEHAGGPQQAAQLLERCGWCRVFAA